ncbi:MAG: type 1 glutamine amidotransferase, partial [Actinomycetota bacterium]
MRPILFARCDDFETFGVALEAVRSAGGEVVIWDAVSAEPAPELDAFGGLVIFGSTYNVEHADEQPFIKELRELTRRAVDGAVPFLGVCFGAQVLAWALDAEVMKAPVREVGFETLLPLPEATSDRLLSHYEDGDAVFEWHMDTFALPEGGTLLAAGDRVRNQAFRVGDRTWGVQFHLEIDAAEVEAWLQEYAKIADLRETWGKSNDDVRAEAR